jgi:hypothetical protein
LPQQLKTKDPRIDTVAFKPLLFPLRDISSTLLGEDLRKRADDAVRVLFASENPVLAVQVVHFADLLPVVRERRHMLKGVKNQIGLGLQARIDGHFYLLWSDNSTDL